MKNKTKTNPNDAAFSNANNTYGNPSVGYGLTKREYFAALAMQGLMNRSDLVQRLSQTGSLYTGLMSKIAVIAVEQASALICELNKETIKPSELTEKEISELKENDEDLK